MAFGGVSDGPSAPVVIGPLLPCPIPSCRWMWYRHKSLRCKKQANCLEEQISTRVGVSVCVVHFVACQCKWYVFLRVSVCGTFSCLSMCVVRFLAFQCVCYVFLRVSMCGTFSCVSVCVVRFLACQCVVRFLACQCV